MQTLEKSRLFRTWRWKIPKSQTGQGVRKKSDFGEKNALWGEDGENSGRKHSHTQMTPTYTEHQN
ncbi:hypothetical protein [Oscillibacter sp. MSJ-31]|uniref:hypothetical protein n=1 Tax=Oscillibacter sp. MSJ-31 TaxID=2841526 RepID=UPI001C110330|nr:hypothetical protein [Oscillibacter sp. MSJ-31]MBU5456956.1 hypothetical protein [Oscillibacter sp. MSJ-31]